MQSFIAELRRRNVLRVAAFYTAGAWVLVQAATQIFPFFDIPNWVVRWVVIAAVVGLPLVMVLSWYYELTPQGLKLESELTAEEDAIRAKSPRLNGWIVAALAIAVVAAVVISGRLIPRPQEGPPAPPPPPSLAAVPPAPAVINDKSIAVLPFENLSDDKANAYFAIGIQDEILTRLAKIGALSVVSRTSTAHYASSPENLPAIAKELGVANILEGSVQKAGDAVHINVQLIHAATDKHVWAETYDRQLKDTFSVESEVAQAIADALNARLSVAEQAAVDQKPTQNAAAYDAYLRGLAFTLSLDQLGSSQRAVEQFTQAVTVDPSFALAWAHLSMVQSLIYFNEDHSPEQLAKVEQAADTAMKLQPELGEAWLAKGYFLYRGKQDYDGALAAFEQARSRLPGSPEVLAATAFVERRQGKWADAIAHLQAASLQDPGNFSYLDELSKTQSFLNRFGDARATIERALQRDPSNHVFLCEKVATYIGEGNLDSAAALLNSVPDAPDDLIVANTRLSLLLVQRQFASAATLMRPLVEHLIDSLGEQAVNAYAQMGFIQRRAGDEAGARASFLAGQKFGEARREKSRSPNLLMNLALIETGLGDRDAALRDAHLAIDLSANDAFQKVQWETTLAEIQANVGDKDDAIDGLSRLLTVPGGVTPVSLRQDPFLDPLHGDPRFQQLIAGR